MERMTTPIDDTPVTDANAFDMNFADGPDYENITLVVPADKMRDLERVANRLAEALKQSQEANDAVTGFIRRLHEKASFDLTMKLSNSYGSTEAALLDFEELRK